VDEYCGKTVCVLFLVAIKDFVLVVAVGLIEICIEDTILAVIGLIGVVCKVKIKKGQL
jgi:hypothetical protein